MRFVFLCALAARMLPGQDLPLMPWPAQVTRTAGELAIDGNFTCAVAGSGASDARVKKAAQRLLAGIFKETGIPISQKVAEGNGTVTIVVERKTKGIQKLGDDESYHLLITPQSARIVATEPLGALRGIETLLQLVHIGTAGFAIPAVDIADQPRFEWRGLSLDVSRHFLPVDAVERTIDGLAAVKMNVLHWHLSDDQGFRVESKRYPRLQQKGSDRLYYTQAEIREIVSYATDRGVRIVPEFDMPGHAASWFPGYPNLASGKGPYEIFRDPGAPAVTMDPTKEATYRFLDGFIGEMARLFPDAYFHIGGDEVSAHGDWANNPHIAAFMKKHKLADFHALQAYFNRRVEKIVARHGKKMIGWDEILDRDLPKSVVIQSWRGEKALAQAAREGYSGILSNGYYLDLMQSAARHYAVDPLKGADLTPEQQKRVLGGEAAMWEELATLENIDAKLWPRLAAIAERFWSPEGITDVGSMYARLDSTSRWLEWQGLQHREEIRLMQERLAGDDARALGMLASILEPMKGYTRHRARKYGSGTAFNRLVDAIAPESEAARVFGDEVASGDSAAVRASLVEWRDNARGMVPVLEKNPLLAEDVEVARAVEEICTIGLAALDGHADAGVLAAIDNDSKAKAEMLIAIAPGVRKLVETKVTGGAAR